jgi:hypothetical protein
MLFDAFLFIDWNPAVGRTSAKPSANAVWSGEYVPSRSLQKQTYHRTRHACFTYLLDVLKKHVESGHRVLVGFDFPYGYPSGFSRALAIRSCPQKWWATWATLAKRVNDTKDNLNNRFEIAAQLNLIVGSGRSGPFWGCPQRKSNGYLNSRSPGFPFRTRNELQLKRLRIVEERLPGVQEIWKIYGVGSVGSQALVGIPYVHKLRRHPQLVKASRVWPFETGFTSLPCPNGSAFIIHAEIWPGLVKQQVRDILRHNPGMIKDCAQVKALCEWAAECDRTGTLGAYFDVPNDLEKGQVQICVEEEGWILGSL